MKGYQIQQRIKDMKTMNCKQLVDACDKVFYAELSVSLYT